MSARTSVASKFGLLIASGCLIAAGCTDQAARQRVEAQQSLKEARAVYQKAAGMPIEAGAEDLGEIRQQFQKVVNTTGSIGQDVGGQAAAARMLAASAYQEIAGIDMQQADSIAAELSRHRRLVEERIESARTLQSFANSLEATTVEPQREHLRAARHEAQMLVDQLSKQIADLDKPIAERSDQIEQARQRIEELRSQADDLLREYSKQGNVKGLDEYKKAHEQSRKADEIEYDVAQKELVLEYDLQPQQATAQLRINKLQQMIDSIEQTLQNVDSAGDDLQSQAQKTRAQLQAAQEEIDNQLSSINEQMSGSLQARYDAALEQLNKAVNAADDAARQLGAQEAAPARLLAVRSHIQRGRVLWAKTRSLAEQHALLGKLVQAGSAAGAVDRFQAELDSLREQYDSAAEATKAAFNEALSAANQVRGRAAELTSLKESINAALQQPMRLPSETKADTSGTADSGMQTGGGQSEASSGDTSRSYVHGQGASSPDEIVQLLNRIASSPKPQISDLARTIDLMAIDTQNDQAVQFITAMRAAFNGFAEIDAALQNQFGQGLSAVPGAGMMTSQFNQVGNNLPTSAELQSSSENSAQAKATMPDGSTETIMMRKIDGQWFMEPTSDTKQNLTGAGGQNAEMAEQMMKGMTQMFEKVGEVMSSFAQRVRNGEFNSLQQVGQALQQTLQQMSGGMGGPSGGGMPSGGAGMNK